jgi:hypothetical protein
VKALFVLACAAASGCTPGHPCATTLTKGPWVQRVDETSATIKWESSSSGCVEAAFAAEGGKETVAVGAPTETNVVASWPYNQKQPDLPGTYYRNQVPLTGLTPSTCYDYRIVGSGQYSGDQPGRFCTARNSGDPITFFAVGDTNPLLGHTLPTFKYTLPTKPDFVIHLGDMHYYTSVQETWAYWFPTMAPMLRAGALFPTIGNHDDTSDGMDSYVDFYGRLFTPASPDMTTEWYHYHSGGVYFFSIDTDEALDAGTPQETWLANTLADASKQPGFRFSVVYMHRPFYTLGDTSPQLTARQVLEPIFMATGVKLVLAGHMHGYERFETPSGITWVTCAGGGGVINDVNANVANYPMDAPYRVAVSNHYHDCLYSVTTGKLSSTVIDEFGATIDQFDKSVP